jgi:hypothetical protein
LPVRFSVFSQAKGNYNLAPRANCYSSAFRSFLCKWDILVGQLKTSRAGHVQAAAISPAGLKPRE